MKSLYHLSSHNKTNQIIASVALIVVVTFLSFSSSLDNDFINWDDPKFVTENYLIRDLSWDTVKTIFSSFYKELFHQPLVLLSFAVEYHFFKLDPFIYHLDNLILHIVNTLLVFYLILTFSQKIPLSLITALFFGIHPLHVESVAWVSERKDVLSTFFFLQSLIFFLLYKERNKWLYYFLSICVLILSLLSKAVGVTLPFVLLLFDYLGGRKFDMKTILEKVPFFIVSGLFVVMNVLLHYSAGAVTSTQFFSHFENFLIACRSVIFYLIKIFMPFNLSLLYPYPELISIREPQFLGSVILLLVLALLVLYSARYTRVVVFGSLFFFITILPMLKLIPFGGGGASMADRYMYIPSIGLFYLFSLAVYNVYLLKGTYEKARTLLLVLFLSVTVVASSLLTYKRNNVWQNSETVWSNVLESYPDNPIAHHKLATLYHEKDLVDLAIFHFEEALRKNPTFLLGHNDLGIAYVSKGEIDKAIDIYRRGLFLNPDSGQLYNSLGLAYVKKGMHGKAIKAFQLAMEKSPDLPDSYNNLGILYYKIGKYDEAKALYDKAISINPVYSQAYTNLGNVYWVLKNYEKAFEKYKRALEINPQDRIAREYIEKLQK